MTATVVTPYRHFAVSVRRVRRLGPSFVRVTFGGEDLAGFADNGYDQRIKLIFPLPGVGLAPVPTGPDWYTRWRELPTELRNPIRTYTVRAVRRAECEVDVDMVCHGDTGPASRWAGTAAPGDPLLLIGPDAAYQGPHGGVEFHPPAGDPTLLLAGDETAVPAICAILERLPGDARGEALLEVPYAEDAQPVVAPAGVRVTWQARGDAPYGAKLVPAVTAAADRLLGQAAAPKREAAPDEVDVDSELLWEVPEEVASSGSGLYAWLAGEAGVIRRLRRHLVAERGVDRRAVAFMGYWRLGRSESDT